MTDSTDPVGELICWLYDDANPESSREELTEKARRRFPDLHEEISEIVDEWLANQKFNEYATEVISDTEATIPLSSFRSYQLLDKTPPKKGGMASVHKAHDTTFGRDVAIKVPLMKFKNVKLVRDKIVHEGQICAKLQHPNIVPIYEIESYPPSDCPYFVMKYVEGNTLLELIEERGREHGAVVGLLRVVREVVGALDHAHSVGVIHRDVKPENVMVGKFGEVHLLDWALAKDLNDCDTPASAEGNLGLRLSQLGGTSASGTYPYMSPEQAGRHESQSEKTDVFGVGALLLTVITGAPLYLGSEAEAIESAKRCRTGPGLSRLSNSSASKTLKRLVAACISENPEQRPSMSEVANQLDKFMESLAESAIRSERKAKYAITALSALLLCSVLAVFTSVMAKRYDEDREAESDEFLAREVRSLARLDEMDLQRERIAQRIPSSSGSETKELVTDLRALDDSASTVTTEMEPLIAFPKVAEQVASLHSRIAADLHLAEVHQTTEEFRSQKGVRVADLRKKLRHTLDQDRALALTLVTGEVGVNDHSELFRNRIQAFRNFGIEFKSTDEAVDKLSRLDDAAKSEITLHLGLLAIDAHAIDEYVYRDHVLEILGLIDDSVVTQALRKAYFLPRESESLDNVSRRLPPLKDDTLAVHLLAAALLTFNGDIAGSNRLLDDVSIQSLTPEHVAITSYLLSLNAANGYGNINRVASFLAAWKTSNQYTGLTLASVALATGRDTMAAHILQSVPRTGENESMWDCVHLLIATKEGKELSAMESYANVSDTDATGFVLRFRTLIAFRRYAQAEVALASMTRKTLNTSLGRRLEAELLYETGNVTEAIATLESLVSQDPTDTAATVRLIRLLVQTGRPHDAETVAKESATEVGIDFRTVEQSLSTLGAKSNPFQLLTAVSACLLNGRIAKETGIHLVRELNSGGQYSFANAAIGSLLAQFKDDPELRAELAISLSGIGKPEEAMAVIEGTASSQSSERILAVHVQLLLETGRSNEAIDVANEARQKHPDSPLGFLLLGRALLAEPKVEDAAATLVECYRKHPSYVPCKLLLANLEQSRGNHALVERHLKELASQSHYNFGLDGLGHDCFFAWLGELPNGKHKSKIASALYRQGDRSESLFATLAELHQSIAPEFEQTN